MAYAQGDYPAAEECYLSALLLSRRVGDELIEGYALHGTGVEEMARSEHRAAVSSYPLCVAWQRPSGSRRLLPLQKGA